MAPPPLPPPPPPISFSKTQLKGREERDGATLTQAIRVRDESSNDHTINEESRPRSTTNSSITSNGVSSMSLPPLPPPSSLVERNTLSQTKLPSESDTPAKREESTIDIMSSNDVTSSGPIISQTMVTSMAPQHDSLVNEKTSLQDAEATTRSAMDNNTNEADHLPNTNIAVAPPIMMPFDNVIPQCLESVEELRSYIMRNPLEHESMEQLMQQNGARSEGEAKLWVLQTIQKRMDEIFHSCWTLIHPSYYTIGSDDNPNNDNELTKEDVDVRLAMLNQIMSKAKQTVLLCIIYVTGYDGTCTSLPNAQASLLPSHDDIIDDGRNNGPPYPIQAAVARLMECALAVIRFHLPSGEHSIQQPPNDVVDDDQQEIIIQCYVHYQTQTLNERSKPAVANLVSLRNVVMKQQHTAQTFGELLIQYAMEESSNHPEDADDDDHDGDDDEIASAQQRRQQKVQPHMFAITTLINEATSLIHPLTCWYDALSPPPAHNGGRQPHETEGLEVLCLRSIQELDKIVSSLVEKLGKWFLIDREIATVWMEHYGIRSNKKRGGVVNQQENTFYNLQQHQKEEILDSIILEELAYLCQLLSRYSKFIEPYLDIAKDIFMNEHATGESTTTSSAIVDGTHSLELMVQEFIGYYSTLEDSLFSRKLSRAMDIATVPAEIYDGIYVSTLVEDAYYLSKRTLERVVSTGNDQAIITLTNRICESWGASGSGSPHHHNGLGGGNKEYGDDDNDILGMYHAIECGIGCDFSALIKQQEELKRQKELSKQRTSNAPSSGSDAFASAFLEALDDDIMTSAGESTSSTNGTSKHSSSSPSRKRFVRTPPTSGNLLSLASFVSTTTTTLEEDVLWQLKSHLCVLNSIASASSACSAIAALYSDVIEGRLLLDSDEEEDVMLHNNNNNDNDVQVNKHQDPTTKMLEFTRDEWKTHSRAYKSMLDQKVNEELDHWVGVALVPSHPDLIPPSSLSSSGTTTIPISSSGIHWLKGVGVGLGGNSTATSTMDSTSTTQDDNKEATMRARHPKPLVQIQMTFCYQNYNISSDLYHKYESTLVSKLIHPLRRCLLIQHISACEVHVKLEIIGTLAKRITNNIILPMMLEGIGHGSTAQLKQFTDWGALLLSKQVRLLQTELCRYLNNDKPGGGVERPSDEGAAATTAAAAATSIPMVNTAPILQAFEKVFQAITILQLEKPSDWLVMRYSSSVGGSDNGSEGQHSNLTIHEIKHIMLLRVGFSPEAVAKVCQTLLQNNNVTT